MPGRLSPRVTLDEAGKPLTDWQPLEGKLSKDEALMVIKWNKVYIHTPSRPLCGR